MPTNGSLNPGQTKTLTVAFTDTNGTAHPLSALPTCIDSSNTLTITEIPTTGNPPQPSDPTFAWTVAAPSNVTAGQNFTLALSGTNPDGTTDQSSFPISITTPDDTVVNIESFQ